MRKIKLLGVTSLCVASLVFTGCGSSMGPPPVSLPTPITGKINITGTVEAPSASANISAPKGLSGKALTEAAASGIECSLYTLEGDDLGSVTTGADGTFTLSADLATFVDSDDTGDAYTVPFIIDCANGMQSYTEGSGTADTSSIDAGTINTDTALAWQALFGEILEAFPDWAVGNALAFSDLPFDAMCIFQAQKAMWKSASFTAGGLADDNAIIKETVMGFMAGGGSPPDAGYASWQDMMQGLLNGTIDDSGAWNTVAGVADDYVDSAYASQLAGGYSSAFDSFTAMDDAFASQFGSDGYGMVAFDIVPATVAGGSICEDIKNGLLDPDALVGPMMAADDATAFASTYGDPKCAAVHFGLLDQCASGGDCSGMINDPGAYYGFMGGYGGDCSGVYGDEGFVDSAMLGGMYEAAKACASAATLDEAKKCGEGMYGMIYQGADGDWDQFKKEGAFDPDKFEFWGGFIMGQEEFDPEQQNWYDNWDTYGGSMGDSAIDECLEAATTEEEMAACFEGINEGNGLSSGPYNCSDLCPLLDIPYCLEACQQSTNCANFCSNNCPYSYDPNSCPDMCLTHCLE